MHDSQNSVFALGKGHCGLMKCIYETGMESALKEARIALLCGEIPVGAAVYIDGMLVASAHNECERQKDPTAHAETLALKRALNALPDRRDIARAMLFVTLEPCAMCAGAAIQSGIDRIVFGAYNPYQGCAGSIYSLCEDSRLGKRIPCIGGVLEEACTDLLKDAFRMMRSSEGF